MKSTKKHSELWKRSLGFSELHFHFNVRRLGTQTHFCYTLQCIFQMIFSKQGWHDVIATAPTVTSASHEHLCGAAFWEKHNVLLNSERQEKLHTSIFSGTMATALFGGSHASCASHQAPVESRPKRRSCSDLRVVTGASAETENVQKKQLNANIKDINVRILRHTFTPDLFLTNRWNSSCPAQTGDLLTFQEGNFLFINMKKLL